jgi:hypothetical protein
MSAMHPSQYLPSLAIAGLVVLFMPSAAGQTLGELANAQRAKQQLEILKIQKDQEDAEIAAKLKSNPLPAPSQPGAPGAASTAPTKARPQIVLHAMYTRDHAWVAELASEQRLALALVGMKINGQTVTAIEQRGLVLSRACTAADVRAKARCGQRVVRVGEAI